MNLLAAHLKNQLLLSIVETLTWIVNDRITLPSLARENNNSPPARTAALLQNGQQVLPSIAFKGQ